MFRPFEGEIVPPYVTLLMILPVFPCFSSTGWWVGCFRRAAIDWWAAGRRSNDHAIAVVDLVLDDLRGETGERCVALAEFPIHIIHFDALVSDGAALALEREATFRRIERAVFGVMCGLNITKMRPPKSSSTKAMMRLGTPIILAAMPTQPLRCASNVSFRSCATARSSSVFSAAADGWLKNGMDVMISRCM